MPRPRLTDEEIAAMRERILDAAVEILHEEGPGALSMRAIAERVGVSHMALYSYFDNKDSLFAALREHQRRHIQARHSDALARARAGDVEIVVREVLEGYIAFARKNPRIFRFLWSVTPEHLSELHKKHGSPHPPHKGKAFHEEMKHLSELIELGMERGVFAQREPLLAALMVTGIINGPLVMGMLPRMLDRSLVKRLEGESLDTAMNYLTRQEYPA